MKQLMTIVPMIAAKWEDVAYSLRFTIASVEMIREQYGHDPSECCFHLLKEWICTDRTPKNWDTLLLALKQAELTSICNEVEKKLKLLVTVS